MFFCLTSESLQNLNQQHKVQTEKDPDYTYSIAMNGIVLLIEF